MPSGTRSRARPLPRQSRLATGTAGPPVKTRLLAAALLLARATLPELSAAPPPGPSAGPLLPGTVAAPALPGPSVGPPPELLLPGASLAGDFRDGHSRGYAVDLAIGQYARVGATLLGAALRIVVRSPAGERLLEVASPTDRYGVLAASLVAAVTGRYTFEVEPLSPTEAAAGGYRIRLETLRPALPDDRLRADSEAALGAAGALIWQGRPADLDRTVALVQSTLPAWTRLQDVAGEAAAHYLIGLAQMMANRHAAAAPFLVRAEALWRRLGDRYGLSKALNQLGRLRRYQGDTRGALAAFQEAIALKRETGQAYGEAVTLYNLARLEADRGHPREAIAAYEQAMEIYRAQGDRSGEEAWILEALGGVYERDGRPAEALDHFQRALALARGLDNANLEAEALDRLGRLRLRLGQLFEALEALAAAVERYRAAGNFASEGLARFDLGALLVEVGEPEEAGKMLADALPLLRDPRDQARARLLLGRIAAASGKLDEAVQLGESALATSRAMEYPEGESEALRALASLDLDRGEAARAREGFDRSLAIAERIGSLSGQAEALRGLGRADASLGRAVAAEGELARALALARRLQDATTEARILEDLARSRRARGDLPAARVATEQALARVESLHAQVAGDHLRASHLAAQREAFEMEVDVLEQLGRADPAAGLAARAFETAERARARGMLDFLEQARVDLREGDPVLSREEERVRLALNAKAALRAERLADPAKAAEVAALEGEIAALSGRYQIVEARLAASSQGYARLRGPAPSVADLQHDALDGDTILLEYFLAEPRSYLWQVTPDALQSFELPGRSRIEALAARVHQGLAQPPGADAAALRQDLATLSRLLLGPVAASLVPGKRLAVVADGALLYVPFAALPLPAAETAAARAAPLPASPLASPPASLQAASPATLSGSRGEREDAFATAPPLIVSHEVINLPSAAVVRELRRARAARSRAAETVAVLADPVFGADDVRLRTPHPPADSAASAASAASASSGAAATTAASTVSAAAAAASAGRAPAEVLGLRGPAGPGARFARLPWTRREAEVVAAEARGRDILVALDFAASRELATAGGLARYRVVHFATHGILDTRRPALSGLVLSRVDERGRPRDGFLRLLDVYHLRLDADLVVLSGCETALGETLRGEGIVGLTRGFFHAGASEVLASLWPIRDRATAELMRRFYHAMLHDRLAPAAALRQAQVSLFRERTWRDAYFWAPFVLQGDWRVPAP
jgi:tetratricopeptide (TPR) repeat protein